MTLHAKAHHECFIAASVNFAVVNEAIIVTR
jgi:organic hydroperoxide reductase OsmC/OhrA